MAAKKVVEAFRATDNWKHDLRRGAMKTYCEKELDTLTTAISAARRIGVQGDWLRRAEARADAIWHEVCADSE